MNKFKALVSGTFLAIALALAPVSSAFAGGPYNGGHGNDWHGGYRYYGWGAWPLVALTAAVVGTAAAIITAPIAVIANAANAPYYYGPAPTYVPPASYNAPSYYAPPQGPAYQGQAGPAYYGQSVPPDYYAQQAPGYYNAPSVPAYYGQPAPQAYYAPPVANYYGARPAPAYYVANRGYYGPRPVYYANGYYGAPGYSLQNDRGQ